LSEIEVGRWPTDGEHDTTFLLEVDMDTEPRAIIAGKAQSCALVFEDQRWRAAAYRRCGAHGCMGRHVIFEQHAQQPVTVAGMRFDQIMPDADALNTALGVLTSKGRWQGIMPHKHADGTVFPMQCDAFFVYDQAGTPISAVVIERDVSEEVRQEQERQALQQQIIDAQQTAIRELSTPLLPISKQVVVMPLVGTIDSQRAQQVMEALLEGISVYRATTVIIDITGVRVVDTQVAQALLQSAQAARLLGAQVFFDGYPTPDRANAGAVGRRPQRHRDAQYAASGHCASIAEAPRQGLKREGRRRKDLAF
jgi:anti-anti-sigma regulatory factor